MNYLKNISLGLLRLQLQKKFVTSDQIKQALLEQIDDNLTQKNHRQLGRILMEKGWMIADQVETVLVELALSELIRKS